MGNYCKNKWKRWEIYTLICEVPSPEILQNPYVWVKLPVQNPPTLPTLRGWRGGRLWGRGRLGLGGANEGLIRGHGLGDFDGDDGHVIAGWEAEGIESIA